MGGCIPAGDVVIKLPLNVTQERRCSDPEELVVEPGVAQLLFDQRQPSARVFGSADPSCRLEANDVSSSLVVIADGPSNDETYVQLCKKKVCKSQKQTHILH